MEYVFAIDPGIKFTGLAWGTTEKLNGCIFNVDDQLQHPISIAIQNFDAIQQVYYDYSLYENRCRTIRIESIRGDTPTQTLLLAKLSTNYLYQILNLWVRSTGIDIELLSNGGIETKTRRLELGLQKTKDKSDKSVKSHINDAVAIWALSFPEMSKFSLPKITKHRAADYCEWGNIVPEIQLVRYKQNLGFYLEKFSMVDVDADLHRLKALGATRVKKSTKYQLLRHCDFVFEQLDRTFDGRSVRFDAPDSADSIVNVSAFSAFRESDLNSVTQRELDFERY